MALRNVKDNLNKKKRELEEQKKKQTASKPVTTAAKTAAKKVTYYSNNSKNKATNVGKTVAKKTASAVKKNPKTPTPYQRQKNAQANVKNKQIKYSPMTKDYSKGTQKSLGGRPLFTEVGSAAFAAQEPGNRYFSLKNRRVSMSPLEQLHADAMAGKGAWLSDLGAKQKELSEKEKAKKIVAGAKTRLRNRQIERQEVSEYDRKYMNSAQIRQKQEASLRYKEAQRAGDKAGMEKAHRDAENLRKIHGYSGGVAGNEYISPDVPQDVYNRLNNQGITAWKQAQMDRQRAVTEDEIAKADKRLEEILNAPGYRKGPATDADTSRGWGYDSEGRRMWSGTKEQNMEDARQAKAAWQATGEGIVGGLAYSGQIANRVSRDKYEAANMNKWIVDADNYISAQSDLEYYDNFVKMFGHPPDGYPNRNVLVMRLNDAIQAKAQLERVRGDVDSLYFDPALAEYYGLPTTRDETFGERMLRQAAEHQAEATEGMSGAEKFVTNALISTGQSLPGMALGVIPGVGPALGLGVLGLQAGGSRAYDLTQQGLTAEEALRGGLVSGGIEILTEKLPLESFADIVKGAGGRSAIRNVLKQAGLEGSEEAVSYIGNWIADEAMNHPDAQFSWTELLENAGMGAVSGGVLGVGGSVIGERRASMPQVEEIQERTQEHANVVSQAQDAVIDTQTEEARRLKTDATVYNELVKSGALSQGEKAQMKADLEARYAELADQPVQQTAVQQTSPQPEAPRTLEEAARQRAETVQPELPYVPWERSKFPPSSLIGSLIDAARENNARNKAVEQLRADQETFRAQQAERREVPERTETQSVQRVDAQPSAQTMTRPAVQMEAQPSVQTQDVGTARRLVQPAQARDILMRNSQTLGENGRKAIMAAFNGTEDLGAYRKAFAQVYDQAVSGKTQEQITQPQTLSGPQFYAAVKAGINDRSVSNGQTMFAAGRNKNAGLVRDSYTKNLDKASFRMIDGLGKASGAKIMFVDASELDNPSAQGQIDGNVIKLSRTAVDPVAFVAGHEMTHRIQDIGVQEYYAFRDYVINKVAVPGAVEAKIREYARHNVRLTREGAMDEIAADYAGNLFNSSQELQKFIRDNYTNKTLLERVLDVFREIANALTGVERVRVDKAVRLLEEALGAASERVSTAEEVGDETNPRDGLAGEDEAISPPARYSLRSFTEAIGLEIRKNEKGGVYFYRNGKQISRVTLADIKKSKMYQLIKLAANNGFISEQDVDKQARYLARLMNLVIKTNDAEMIYAFEGSMAWSAVKDNADKQYGMTIDFEAICKKTEAMVAAMSEAMMRKGSGLTLDEINVLYSKVVEAGETVPCPPCYVFSRWIGLGGLLDNIKKFQTGFPDTKEGTAKAKKRLEEIRGILSDDIAKLEAEDNARVQANIEAQARGEKKTKRDLNPKPYDDLVNAAKKKRLETLNSEETKLITKRNKALNKLQFNNLSAVEKAKVNEELAKLDEDYMKLAEQISTMRMYSWLKDVRLADTYKEVPDSILFDLRKGEKFASEDYKDTWAFRTGQGAYYGKAITPYTDMRIGEIIQGVHKSASDIKIGKSNPFSEDYDADNPTTKQKSEITSAMTSVRRQNLRGGVRMQSVSDFRYEYGLDYIQAFFELQSVGAAIQTYSKVVEFVNLAASTGAYVNMSLIPWGDGFKDGKLAYSSVTGMDADAAFQLQKENDTAGTILIGVSDEHIRAAMADKNIYFIIPYHKSGGRDDVIRQMLVALKEKVTKYTDYTDVQSEKFPTKANATLELRNKILKADDMFTPTSAEQKLIDGNKYLASLYERKFIDKDSPLYMVKMLSDDCKQIYPYEYWDTSSTYKTADVNGARYLEWCEALEVKPKFSGDAKGEKDFRNDKGYWKLLIDRRMYDRKGRYNPLVPINVSGLDTKQLDRQRAKEKFGAAMTDPADLRKTRSIVDAAFPETAESARFSISPQDGFSVSGSTASYTDERIDTVLKEYGGGGNYAQGFVTYIDPNEFLKLTLRDSTRAKWEGGLDKGEFPEEFFPLDEEKLRGNRQTPYLRVHTATGEVEGHEGRHRMLALARAGITKAPVVLVDTATKYSKEPTAQMRLTSQDFGYGPVNGGYAVTVENLLPTNKQYRDQIKEAYGSEDARVRFSITPQTDADYMAAVERGDMETAQRMVDEAAKAAGYNVKVYHGTTQEMQSASRGRLTGKEYDQLEKDYADKLFPFVVFKSGIAHAGIYTATDRGVAEDFMFTFSHGGTVFDLYAKTKNPLVVDAGGKGWNNIPYDAADAVGLTSEILKGLDSYQKTRNKKNIYIDDLVEYAKGKGHDGVIVENVRETGFGDEDSPITTDVIVFDPNQVKSADPVTYDDDGNVIPLSERFDEGKQDIRFSISAQTESPEFKQWFGDWQNDPAHASKVVNSDGSPKVVYHQTGKEFWTFDNSNPVAGKTDSETPSGFFFKENDHDIGIGGARQVATYLDMKKPLHFRNREAANVWYSKNIDGYKDLQDEMKAAVKPLLDRMDELEREMFSEETDEEMYEALDQKWNGILADLSKVEDSYRGRLHDMLNRYFLDNDSGYDGIILDYDGHRYVDGKRENVKSYIVFDRTQIKSATDNVGTFDRENPDTRHSLAGGMDNARLMRENEKLRDRVEYWKGQTKKSDRIKVDPKEVRKLAKKLAGDFSTTMDTAEISGQLQAIYDGLGKDWTYDQAYEAAHSLAMEMVEQASETDDHLYHELANMRDWFQDHPIVVPNGNPSFELWRKHNFGRFKASQATAVREANLHEVYHDLSEMWPEWFNEEKESTPMEQMNRIMTVLDDVYSTNKVNPYADDLEAPAGYLSAEIMDSFWDLPNVKKTWADRAEARLGREVTRRLDMQEKYQEKLRQVREDRDKKLKQKSEEYLGKKRAASQRQKERERRAQIMRHARDLSRKLLKPSDKQHIPQELRKAVAAVLDSVDLSSSKHKDTNRTKAFQELRLAYQEIIQQGESLVIDPDLMDNIMEVEAMRDTPIQDLNLSQLETIWKTIRAVEASITTANKAFGRQRFATIFEAADGLRQAMGNRKDRGDYRGPVGAFDKLLNSGMLTPESFFHRMGQTGQDIFRMLRNAQDKHIGIMQEAQGYTEDALFEKLLKEKPSKNPVRKAVQDEKLRKIQRKIETEVHTFDFDGQRVQLTTAQIMSLYELMKRQQAIDHITVGGIKPEGIEKGARKKAPSEPYRLTLDQISEIVDSLTEEQMEMADKLQKYMGGRLAQLGNEASMAVYGYEKFNEKNYFPIKVDKNQTITDQTKEAQAATIAGRGFTKSTTPKANNALIVRNIFDVYADHVTDMATYSSWLEAMENLQRIYNFTFRDADGNRTGTVKANLERTFGRNGLSYWEKLTEDLNNGVHGTNDNPFNALIGNYKASAIGANIRVFIQQPTAILRALDDINPVDFLAGLGRGTVFTTWKKVKKYAPIAVWKDWGYFDADTGRQMKSILFGDDSALAKVNNTLMVPAGFMDSVGWSHIWNALEAETRRTRKDLKPRTDAFYEAVAARFNAVIDHSQVVDGILQRSQVMRSPDALTKMATSFMAEPTKVYNMFTTAVYDLKHSQDPKARTQAMKVLGRTAFGLIASFFANAAAQSLVDALRDDDKDEEYWEKFFQAFYGLNGDEETTGEKVKNAILEGNLGASFNPATYIPWAKDIVSLAQGFKVSRMDMDSISKFVQEIGSTWKAFHGDGKITLQNALSRLTAEGARLLGVPVANIKRDVLAVYSTVMNGQKNYLGQFELQKWLYRLDSDNNWTDFVKIAYAAQQAGDTEAYEKIRAELVDVMGQDAFDKRMKNQTKKDMEEGGDLAQKSADAYGAYETMMTGNTGYQSLTPEQQTKVQNSMKKYAEMQAMESASNGEVTNASNEMIAIKAAEEAGVDPVTWKSFRVYTASLEGTGDIKGPAEAWLDENDVTGSAKEYCMAHYN